jgi:ubiquinone biosynthesis protein COQ4
MRPQELMDGRIRPFVAAKAFYRLMKDKDDTAAVVLFITSMNGDWYGPISHRFQATPNGARLLAKKADIYRSLSDLNRLRAMPPGSLGRTYIDELDACGLTIDGFREAQREAQDFSFLPEEWRLAHYRILDIHDLLHTLVGWARDALAEVCILEFQGVQYGARGWRLLGYLGGAELKRRYPDTPVFACLREARDIALSLRRWVLDFDWEGSLEKPLEDVRRELGVRSPQVYLSVHDLWQRRNTEMMQEIASKKAAKVRRAKSSFMN